MKVLDGLAAHAQPDLLSLFSPLHSQFCSLKQRAALVVFVPSDGCLTMKTQRKARNGETRRSDVEGEFADRQPDS